jgi:hypothetical protein
MIKVDTRVGILVGTTVPSQDGENKTEFYMIPAILQWSMKLVDGITHLGVVVDRKGLVEIYNGWIVEELGYADRTEVTILISDKKDGYPQLEAIQVLPGVWAQNLTVALC